MAGVECITLDEEDEVGVGGALGTGAVGQGSAMVRCAMCVDPGLLPVETDMAGHRREVHRWEGCCGV